MTSAGLSPTSRATSRRRSWRVISRYVNSVVGWVEVIAMLFLPGPVAGAILGSGTLGTIVCLVIPSGPFGSTGHQSRRTLFGAAALGKVTEAEADRARELVLRYDLNHLDTAASYGDSELQIAKWLAREGRDRFFLATKTGRRTYGEARDEIRASLRRLGVDHIDLLQLHNLVDQAEWDIAFGKDGALRAAAEARDAGLVRFISVTGHGVQAPRRHRESLRRFPFHSGLFPYNATPMRDEADRSSVV